MGKVIDITRRLKAKEIPLPAADIKAAREALLMQLPPESRERMRSILEQTEQWLEGLKKRPDNHKDK